MDQGDIVETLVENSVIEPAGQSLRFTDEFSEEIDRNRSRADELKGGGGADTEDGALEALLEVDPDPTAVSIYLGLAEFASGLSPDTRLGLVALLVQLQRDVPPTDGAPAGFFPIDGDLLELATTFNERSIVYVWRHDCEPCDIMRDEFEDVLADGHDEPILKLAVYGPDWPDLLEEEYGVVAGPTTLFMLGNRVDTRLVGAQFRSVITNEIETLVDLTPEDVPH